VLHNWPSSDAAPLLRGCAAAAGDTGRILVVDQVVNHEDHPKPVVSTNRDLCMLVTVGGQERTLAEFTELGASAGLRLAGVTLLSPDGSVFSGAVSAGDRPRDAQGCPVHCAGLAGRIAGLRVGSLYFH
jgi:hypothetical protein